MIGAVILVLAVAVLAIVLRAMGGKHEIAGATDDATRRELDEGATDADVGDEPDEDGMVEAAALTSDGWAFVPRGTGLELIPPGEEDELLEDQAQRHGSDALRKAMAAAPLNPHTGRRLVFWRPGDPLGPGDFVAARVVRGAPSVDPWRLEVLGRDRDYRAFPFETEEAARTALTLVEERIVRPPRDAAGDPIPIEVEDFVVARREHEETEQALAMEPEDETER